MTLSRDIEQSDGDIAAAEANFASRRSELMLIIFTKPDVADLAASLFLALEADLGRAHARRRLLMEEAIREPFRSARP